MKVAAWLGAAVIGAGWRLGGGGWIALWAAGVLVTFFACTGDMVAPAAGFAVNAALLALTAYLAILSGFRVVRRFEERLISDPYRWDPLERTVLEFGLGLGALIAALFAMGLLGLYRPRFAVLLLVVLSIGPHRALLSALRRRASELARENGPGGAGAFWWCASAVGLMTLLVGLTPATAQDALAYHLAIPAKYIEHGGMFYLSENFFAQFPGNMETLFTLALLLRGSPLAGAYHWLTGAAAAASVAVLARRLAASGPGADSRTAGLAGFSIFATIPTVALIAGWAYVDLCLVLFTVLSTLAFLRFWEMVGEPGRCRMAWLIFSGLFAGLAAGCKYTGGVQGLLIVVGALVEGRLRRRGFLAAVSAGAVAALATGAVASPWWIKSFLWTGNPLFPFLFGVFGGRNWDAERARVLSAFLVNWGQGSGTFLDTILLPWRLTMSARFFSMEAFDGMIGPAFLIGAPMVIWSLVRGGRDAGWPAGRDRLLVALALCAGHGLLWVSLSRQIRFLLPSLAPAAALIAGSLYGWLPRDRWREAVAAALKLGLAFNVALITTYFAAHNPLPVVLGIEPEGRYLRREVPGGDYAVFEFIDQALPRDSYLLFAGSGNPGFLSKRRYHCDPIFENRTLLAILRSGKDADGVHAEFRRRGFTHLLFRWELVFDSSSGGSELSTGGQHLLAAFLNRHARLLARAGSTMLYAVNS